MPLSRRFPRRRHTSEREIIGSSIAWLKNLSDCAGQKGQLDVFLTRSF
jgi:hypothetical protein